VEIKDVLVEGTTKKVFATSNADEVLIEFLDTLPSHLAKKKETVKGKAAINNAISSSFYSNIWAVTIFPITI